MAHLRERLSEHTSASANDQLHSSRSRSSIANMSGDTTSSLLRYNDVTIFYFRLPLIFFLLLLTATVFLCCGL